MPLFKVQIPNSAKTFLTAESSAELIKLAKDKWQLPNEKSYMIVTNDDKTAIESDEILLSLSQSTQQILDLLIICTEDFNSNVNSSTASLVKSTSSEASSCDAFQSGSRTIKQSDLEEHVWSQVSPLVLGTCKNEKLLEFSQRRSVIHKIVEYLIDNLNDTRRSVVNQIAKLVCQKYPKTFNDTAGLDETWGTGHESLRMEIYNALMYKKSKNNKRNRIQNLSVDNDSDDEEQQHRLNNKAKKAKQNEYGCVDYAPVLPDTETAETQETKRLELSRIFESGEENTKTLELFDKTYPTVRAVINERERDLQQILQDWPYIQTEKYITVHCSRLLGFNVSDIWDKSLAENIKHVRQYLRFRPLKVAERAKVISIIDESKIASIITKDKKPKQLVVFKLLAHYYQENEDHLFLVLDRETPDENILDLPDSQHPLLVIRGSSLYDETAKCNVLINKQLSVQCADALKGFMIVLLSYYMFDYAYPTSIENTVEFIQRVLMKINPPSGNKRDPDSKKRSTSYNPRVRTLIKNIKEFNNSFNL